MSKYLRIPFEESKVQRIEAELSLKEQQRALVDAYNEKVEDSNEEDRDVLSQYESVREIRDDGSLTEVERKQLILRARRNGLPR